MKKILLEGPVLTQSGYGEHTRLVFKSLIQDEGLEIYLNPLSWGSTSWVPPENLDLSLSKEIGQAITNFQKYYSTSKNTNKNMSFDIQIHVGIPSEFQKKAPHSICVTAGIETDRVSADWLMKTHKGIDRLIVPSEHSKRPLSTPAGVEQQ